MGLVSKHPPAEPAACKTAINHYFRIFILVTVAAVFTPYAEEWAVDKGSAYAKGSKAGQFGLALYPVGLIVAYEYGYYKAISGGIATGVMIDPHVYIPMIVRSAFHPFNLKAWANEIAVRDKLDVYIGLASGFQFGEDAPYFFIIREYFGIRYYFNSKFGVFAEDCAGLLNIGLAIKL